MTLINADMERLEKQVRRAEEAMSAALSAALYGTDAESRVRQLRASVLGNEAKPTMVGLAALSAEGNTR